MRNVNWNELIWFAILFSFSIYLFFLIASGDILYFIHPRSVKFTISTMAIFSLLTIFQVKRIINAPRRPLHLGYLIFILPLIMGITIAPRGVTEQIAHTRGISIATTQQEKGFSLFSTTGSSTKGGYATEGILVIDDSIFEGAVNHIKNNIDLYEGQQISLSGFIFRHDHFDDDTIFISRLLITCCAADAMITGILADGEGLSDYEDYEWIEIQGVIDRVIYFDPWLNMEYEAPIVRASTSRSIEKPLYPYVYPSEYGGQ